MSQLSDYRRCVSDPLEKQLRADNAKLRTFLRNLLEPSVGMFPDIVEKVTRLLEETKP